MTLSSFNPNSTVLLLVSISVLLLTMYVIRGPKTNPACPLPSCPPPSCPPCKEYKCTISNPSERLPTVPPAVLLPVAPGPAKTNDPIPGKPTRQYVNSGDTTWYELGFVNSEGGKRLMLRLFGRRRFPRSDRYEYFLSTKDGISIPFKTPNDVELINGDKVDIPGFENKFVSVIYPVEVPQYSPSI